jgi:hypothetical protein
VLKRIVCVAAIFACSYASAFARDEHPDIRDKVRRGMVCSGHTLTFQGNDVQFDNRKGWIGRFNGRSLKFFVDDVGGDMYVADFIGRTLDTPDGKTLTCDQKATTSAAAEVITCTGKLSETSTLAVVVDAAGYTCTVDMRGSGHDPMRPCSVGDNCQITGRGHRSGTTGKTYAIDEIIAVAVKK